MTTGRMVAGMGVCVRVSTRRIRWWAGKRLSRDIAKIMREQLANVTIPPPKKAIAMTSEKQAFGDGSELVAHDRRDGRIRTP